MPVDPSRCDRLPYAGPGSPRNREAAGWSHCRLRFPHAKTFPIAGRPELRVETDDGSVTVRPWDEPRIAARVTTSGWKIGPGEVQIRESQTGDRVELVVRLPHRSWGLNFHRGSIRVELQVPRQIRVDVRTGDGGIDIQ